MKILFLFQEEWYCMTCQKLKEIPNSWNQREAVTPIEGSVCPKSRDHTTISKETVSTLICLKIQFILKFKRYAVEYCYKNLKFPKLFQVDLAREVSELLKTEDGGDKAIEKMKDERYKRTIFWMDHGFYNNTLLHYAAARNCNNFLKFVLENEKVSFNFYIEMTY